jgi:hypothetical protein
MCCVSKGDETEVSRNKGNAINDAVMVSVVRKSTVLNSSFLYS